jgi:RNA polymerase sigma factor (sigma-70 family)
VTLDDRTDAPHAANGLTQVVLGPDAAALVGRLYDAHADAARSLAIALLSDEQRAEDAVHVAYLTILRRLLHGWRWGDEVEARATVLRNTRWAALNAIRERRRSLAGGRHDPVPTEERPWAESEARLLVERIVAQLRPRYRLALHCRYVEELPARDAAARLGITVKAYARLVERAVLAARRAALGPGLSPLGAVVALVRRRDASSGRPSTSRPRLPHPPGWMSSIAHGVAVVAMATSALGAARAIDTTTAPAPTASAIAFDAQMPDVRLGETIDDALVIDVASASTGGAPTTLVALGEGRRCGCSVLFETMDGGNTWTVAPAPAIGSMSPRVAVPAGFPGDPRIAIIASSGGDGLVSAGFGESFLPAPAGSVDWTESRRAPCSSGRTGLLDCFGRAVSNPDVGSGEVRGSAILLRGGWLLYLRPLGGLLCSRDGLSWAPTCSP